MSPEELDAVILGILASTPMGRDWLAAAERRVELERRLLALKRRGLCQRLVDDLWWLGDLDLVGEVERATPEGIAALNGAA